jgi:DNA polymerase III delta prime subunit
VNDVARVAIDGRSPDEGLGACATPTRGSLVVGRDEILARVRRWAVPGALVTVYGPPGIGKSAVSLALQRELGGVVVDCLDVEGAAVLRARLDGAPSDGPLILDAIEGLDAEALDLLSGRIAAARVPLIATSLRATGLANEVRIPLPPLGEEDAIALLSSAVERRSGRMPSTEEQLAARTLVARFGGHPLALELCAAQASVRTLDALAKELDDPLDLVDPAKDRAPRHRSLRAALETLWGRLPAKVRDATAALSIFESRFDLQAATALLGPGAGAIVDEALRWSVASAEAGPRGMRFEIFRAVRTFARDALAARGDSDEVARAWAAHVVARVWPHAGDRPRIEDLAALHVLEEWRTELVAVAAHPAIDLATRVRALLAASRLEEDASEFAAAAARLAAARELVPKLEDRALVIDVLLRTGSHALRIERALPKARAVLDELAAFEPDFSLRDRLRKRLLESRVSFIAGDDDAALAAADEVTQRAASDPTLEAEAAVIRFGRGELPLDEIARSARGALEASDASIVVLGAWHALVVASKGEAEAARDLLSEYAARLAGARPRWAYMIGATRSDLERAAGDLAAAAASAREYLEIVERASIVVIAFNPWTRLVRALLASGDLEGAATTIAGREAEPDSWLEIERAMLIAALSAMRGDRTAANEFARVRNRATKYPPLLRETLALEPLVPLGIAAEAARHGRRARAKEARDDARRALEAAVAKIGDDAVMLAIARAELARVDAVLETGEWIVVEPDGSFSIDDAGPYPVSAAAARAILRTLAQAHARGVRATDDDLVTAAWPGERLIAKAAGDRLRNAIAVLRRAGLEERVVRLHGDYALAADLRVLVRG